jgi:hypothetical protein
MGKIKMTLITSKTIIERASYVDQITDHVWIEEARKQQPQQPQSRELAYNSLSIYYGFKPVDGRVMAVYFIDRLHADGIDCRVARPSEFDDPAYALCSIGSMELSDLFKRNNARIRAKGEGDLVKYSDGIVQIVDAENNPFIWMSGIKNPSSYVTLKTDSRLIQLSYVIPKTAELDTIRNFLGRLQDVYGGFSEYLSRT